jgi:hypothetical protein
MSHPIKSVWSFSGAICIAGVMALGEVHGQGSENLLDLVDVIPPSASGIVRSELLIVQPTGKSAGGQLLIGKLRPAEAGTAFSSRA